MRKFSSDAFGRRLARISLVAFGEKIRDDRLDGDKKLRVAVARMLWGRLIRRAEREEAQITANSRAGTDKINELQAQNADLRAVLGAYGESVATTFSYVGEMNDDAYRLIRALAEWTFFVDMLCDYDEDVKKGKPNTLYDGEHQTLREYFDNRYTYLLKENKRLVDDIMTPLLAINDESDDWRALYTIVVHALDTVVCELLRGADVEFHYFKELGKNYRAIHEHEKQRKLEKKLK